MFSILNCALSQAVTSFGNKFCLKKRSRLIKVLDKKFTSNLWNSRKVYFRCQCVVGLRIHGISLTQGGGGG